MLNSATLFTFLVAMGMGFGVFHIKYQVMNLEKHYKQVQNTIRDSEELIHVLKAEWAHLNEPSRLHILTKKYLTDLKPSNSAQLVRLSSLPKANDFKHVSEPTDFSALENLLSDISLKQTLDE